MLRTLGSCAIHTDKEGAGDGQGTDVQRRRLRVITAPVDNGVLEPGPENSTHHYHVYDETGSEVEPETPADSWSTRFVLPPGRFCLTIGTHAPRELILFEVESGSGPRGGGLIVNWHKCHAAKMVPSVWREHWPRDLRFAATQPATTERRGDPDLIWHPA